MSGILEGLVESRKKSIAALERQMVELERFISQASNESVKKAWRRELGVKKARLVALQEDLAAFSSALVDPRQAELAGVGKKR